MQIMAPIVRAETIPAAPECPVTLRRIVTTRRVATVIPEAGLLLLPTIPVMRAETEAKKNPKIKMRRVPNGPTGMRGRAAIKTRRARIITRMTVKGSYTDGSLSRFFYL